MLAHDGILYQVKCIPCSNMRKTPLLLQPRSYTMEKHDACEKLKKNDLLYVAKHLTTVLEQVNKYNSKRRESHSPPFSSV